MSIDNKSKIIIYLVNNLLQIRTMYMKLSKLKQNSFIFSYYVYKYLIDLD